MVSVLRLRAPDHAILAEEGSLGASDAALSMDRRSARRHDQLHPRRADVRGVDRPRGPSGLVAGAVHDPVPRRDLPRAPRRRRVLERHAHRMHRTRSPGCGADRDGLPFREMAQLPAYLAAFERFVRSTSGLRRRGICVARPGLHGLRHGTTDSSRSDLNPGTWPGARSSSWRRAASSPMSVGDRGS